MRALPLLLLTMSPLLQAATPDWENPAVFRVGTEPPRATALPFADADAARAGDRAASPFVQSLNGDWRFAYFGRPEACVEGFEAPAFDDGAWATIPVPANWQLHGYGIPLYSNARYPFAVDPPRVRGEPPPEFTNHPEDQRAPVGLYRRTFRLPPAWAGREVFLTFDGIDSAAYVWLNGELLGYTQDSRTPAEFHLNGHLVEGDNVLAVQVFQYSDGSYLEDQDMWRLSGIFRDVTLWSSAPVQVRDLEARPRLNYAEGMLGELGLDLTLRNLRARETEATVEVSLFAPTGERLLSEQRIEALAPASETTASLQFEFEHVEPWTAETPNLYTLVLGIRDEVSEPFQYTATRLGFRTVELKDGQVLVNGEAILFKGINRHEHEPDTGHAVTREDIREDLLVMKRLNINAIRTSHYPNLPAFYELCDELGFYLFDEANLESHGLGWNENPLAGDPAWYPAFHARIRAMVERDKNHPSVLFWSMGNESGEGENFERLAGWIHERDPSRLVHYDRAMKKPYVDVFSNMYHHPDRLASYLEWEMRAPPENRHPVILCEYNHAMGNSSGNLGDYWDRFRAEPMLQGGFIWDFKDQGLDKTWPTPDGPRQGYAYGGDFGDQPNDGSFCFNGVVGPDHRWSPQAWEVRKVYQDIWTHLLGVAGTRVTVDVYNERFFRPTDAVRARWILTGDGVELARGDLGEVVIEPRSHETLAIELGERPLAPDREYHLRIGFEQTADTAWAPAGTEIAWDQHALPLGARVAPALAKVDGELAIEESDGATRLAGDDFALSIDARGRLVEYSWKGRELLAAPLQLDFWRAPTNNDRGREFPTEAAFWKTAAAGATVTPAAPGRDRDRASLKFEYALGDHGGRCTVAYDVRADGVIGVTATLHPAPEDGDELPRFGMQVELDKAYTHWSWYGYGPHENYRDRVRGAWLAVHAGEVDGLFHRYLDPQEAGNRTGVRWTRFDAEDAEGLTFVAGMHLLEVSAQPYTDEALEHAKHPHELPPPDRVVVNLDYGQTGLGGVNSWGAKPLERYRLLANRDYRYSFFIVPPGVAVER